MRRDISKQLLRKLLENSKRSDRELARALKVSQPTITRIRRRLEKNGMIRDYTIIPDFKRLGFELLAITFVKMRSDVLMPGLSEKARDYTEKFPNAIFVATGEGLGMTGVIFSFHYDYSDYHRKWNQMRLDWKDLLMDIQSFIISLKDKEGEIKRFSLTHLKDVPIV
jgi:DNA-binding Lrp family transcriptional regulator